MNEQKDDVRKIGELVDGISAVIERDRDWKIVAIALGYVVSACEDLADDADRFRGRFESSLASARSVDLSHLSRLS